MQFTLILGAQIEDSHFVRWIIPAFETEYAAGLKILVFLYKFKSGATKPYIEAMLIITPPLFLVKRSFRFWQISKIEVRLIFIAFSQLSIDCFLKEVFHPFEIDVPTKAALLIIISSFL